MAAPNLAIRIVANTSELVAALASAQGAIVALGPSVAKLQASWTSASAKLVQDARSITAAVSQVGTSTMTAGQAASSLKTLEAAMAQMGRAGQTIPPQMVATAASLRQVGEAAAVAETKTVSWKNQLSGLAASLGIAFSIGAVVQFGRALLAMGDELVKTSDRTGLTIEEVQRLSFVATQSGNSLDELTSAIGQMQNRLASGDASAVGALKALNLSFDQLRAASPYEQLQLIAAAIATIPNPATKAQVAMDLFGKSGIAILPTLTAEFDKLGDAAPVMSDKTVRALDEAGDAIDRLKLTTKVWAAESYNASVSFFVRIIAEIYKYIGSLADAERGLLEFAQGIPGAARLIPDLAGKIETLRKQSEWYSDAAKGMTAQTIAATDATKKAVPPFEANEKAIKAAQAAAEAHAKALQAIRDKITGAALLKDLADLEAVYATLTPAQLANEGVTTRLKDAIVALKLPIDALPKAFQDIVLPMQAVSDGLTFIPGKAEALAIAVYGIETRALTAIPVVTRFGDLLGTDLPVELDASKQAIDDWILSLEAANEVKPPDPSAWERFNGALVGQLGDVSAAFVTLAQVSNGSLSTIFQTIAQIVSAMQLANKGSGQLKSGFDAIDSGNVAEGLASIASGVASVVAAMDQATSSTSRWANALGGFMTGAQAGSAFGGWGALIGGIAGLIIGATRNTNDFAAAQARAAQAAAAEKQALEEQAAALRRLLDAAKDLGSVSQADFDWLNVIAFNGSEGIDELTAAIKTQLLGALNDAVTAGKPFSQSMLDAIANAQALGLATEELAAIIQQSQSNSIAGLQDLIENVQVTGEAGEAAAQAIIVGFDAILMSGADINELFAATGTSLVDLQARMKAAGLEGTDAFKKIAAMAATAGNEISQNAVVAARGAVAVLVSLQQQGRLTDQVFAAMTGQVWASFKAMEAQGQGGTQALRRLQPELQTIWEMQKDFGYVVDESTQLLLDQGIAAGLVGDQHRSAQEKTALAMERVVALLQTLVDKLVGPVAGAAESAGARSARAFDAVGAAINDGVLDPLQDAVTDANRAADTIADRFNNLNPQVTVDIDYNDPGWSPPDPGDLSVTVPGFASGSDGFRDFGRGTPAMLHGIERVQTPAQARAEASVGGGNSEELKLLREIASYLRQGQIVQGEVVMDGQRMGRWHLDTAKRDMAAGRVPVPTRVLSGRI